MSGLQAWIKQLILVVFLAGVAEMLLPQSGMRKYAHTALGLLVLLTTLVPFLGLLRQDIGWDAAFAPAMTRPDGEAVAGNVERLKEVDQRLTLETYRRQVAERVAAAAMSVEGVGRATAVVSIDEAPRSPRFGTVTAVEVFITPDAAGGLRTGVTPVDPLGRRSDPAQADAGDPGRRVPPALREAVAGILAREFDLPRGRITVRPAPGTAGDVGNLD